MATLMKTDKLKRSNDTPTYLYDICPYSISYDVSNGYMCGYN